MATNKNRTIHFNILFFLLRFDKANKPLDIAKFFDDYTQMTAYNKAFSEWIRNEFIKETEDGYELNSDNITIKQFKGNKENENFWKNLIKLDETNKTIDCSFLDKILTPYYKLKDMNIIEWWDLIQKHIPTLIQLVEEKDIKELGINFKDLEKFSKFSK